MNMARMKRSTTRLRLADYDADVSHLCTHVLHAMPKNVICHVAGSNDETTDDLLLENQLSLIVIAGIAGMPETVAEDR